MGRALASAGFRLVDTAAHYPGESGVGDALASLEARGTVRPGEVQVVSKVRSSVEGNWWLGPCPRHVLKLAGTV